MKQKLLVFFIVMIPLIGFNQSYALELVVSPRLIEFDSDATPIQIELSVFDKGKPIRWDSSRLKTPSSKITVISSEGESLGLDSDSGFKFIPIGSVDGLTYRLVAVVDRSIKDKISTQVVISIANRSDLISALGLSIPDLSNRPTVISTSQVAEAKTNDENMSDIENKVDDVFMLVSVIGVTIAAILIGLLQQFISLSKSDSVTKDVGDSIKNLQERQAQLILQENERESASIRLHQERESNKIRYQQSDSHHALDKQGREILVSTSEVHTTAKKLVEITNLIDLGVRDFSRNPDQNNGKIIKDVKKLKKLVQDVSSSSESSSHELSDWISRVEENRDLLVEIVDEISESVHHFTGRADDYDKMMIKLYNYITNLTYQQENTMKDHVIRTMDNHFREMGIEIQPS